MPVHDRLKHNLVDATDVLLQFVAAYPHSSRIGEEFLSQLRSGNNVGALHAIEIARYPFVKKVGAVRAQ